MFALLVLALAGVQLQKISDRVTVMYLLDQSESIPKLDPRGDAGIRDEGCRRPIAARATCNRAAEDKAGVIIFGREATIEHPPFADEIRAVGMLESLFELRTDATNIASALKLAQASFPEDSAKRIVIVTDGNENLGDARTIARTLADNGIGIDVVPIQLTAQAEVAVEKSHCRRDIRRGQPIEARVVLENYTQPSEGESDRRGERAAACHAPLRQPGRAARRRRAGSDAEAGQERVSLQHTIDVPAGYTYRADFVPGRRQRPTCMLQNNSATAFTHVRGKGRVLLIEDWENPGEFDYPDPAAGRDEHRSRCHAQRPAVHQPGRAAGLRLRGAGQCAAGQRRRNRQAGSHATSATSRSRCSSATPSNSAAAW